MCGQTQNRQGGGERRKDVIVHQRGVRGVEIAETKKLNDR